jgi:hypothetical protein
MESKELVADIDRDLDMDLSLDGGSPSAPDPPGVDSESKRSLERLTGLIGVLSQGGKASSNFLRKSSSV